METPVTHSTLQPPAVCCGLSLCLHYSSVSPFPLVYTTSTVPPAESSSVSHPVRSEPQGPSLWLSYRHHRRLWRAQTASSSQRCTGERRFSATTPPSWQAAWAWAAATPTGRGGTERERWVNCAVWVQQIQSHRQRRMRRSWRTGRAFLMSRGGHMHRALSLTHVSC